MLRTFFSVLVGSLPLTLSASIHAEGTHTEAEHVHDHSGESDHVHAEGEEHDDHDHDHDHDHEGEEHDHEHGSECSGHDHGSEEEGVVELFVEDKALHSLDMQIDPVSDIKLQAEKAITGQLVTSPQAITSYALPVAGKVTYYVKPAQQVNQGTLLFSVDSPELATNVSEAMQAKAELARCQAELSVLEERQATLDQIGTKNSELNTSIRFKKAEELSLQANLAAKENILSLLSSFGQLKGHTLYVHADKDGVVQNLDLAQGAWGDQGANVLVCVAPRQLEFKGMLIGMDSVHYSKAMLSLTLGNKTEFLNGTLRISPLVDTTTLSRTVYFTPDQLPQGAYDGQVATLELFSSEETEGGYLTIPDSAVVKVGIDQVVFLKVGKNEFVMKKVQTLPSRFGRTPVKGLTPGEMIVTKGGYELKYILPEEKAGTKKTAGHFHADGQFHEGSH